VTHAEVIGEVEDARFWPQAEGDRVR